MTQPTFGLGALCPRASLASASASPIHLRSSLNPELLLELLELPLFFLLSGEPVRLILLLVGNDLSVGAVRRIEVDVGDLWTGIHAHLRVDDELDDDDCRDQQCEGRADHLLTAALPHEGSQVAERG